MWDKRAHWVTFDVDNSLTIFFYSYNSIIRKKQKKGEKTKENGTRKTHWYTLSAKSISTCLFFAMGVEKKNRRGRNRRSGGGRKMGYKKKLIKLPFTSKVAWHVFFYSSCWRKGIGWWWKRKRILDKQILPSYSQYQEKLGKFFLKQK